MSSIFRPQQSFLQNNAWQNQALNALHYNTAQQGSVVALVYGTARVQINLINFDGYMGPSGKKGKTGSLPVTGTARTGKGGGGSKGKGGKKSAQGHYTINVDFGICQGPVTDNPGNAVYSSSGVETLSSSGLYFWPGADGQTGDPHFGDPNYSGTCHITGVPMDLGQSPVIPNLSFEITGLLAGENIGGYTADANPADVVTDFLTNPRYGAGFPLNCMEQLVHDGTGVLLNRYGDYCQAASLVISTVLDGHQKAIEWLAGLCTLTNSALVWSGRLLKIKPYGDLTLSANGATWDPNWVYQYDLDDDDLLPWHPRQEGSVPTPGEDDPIIVTRTNPSDADNWMSIEYTDRFNFYNSTILTAFDQGAIDTYGLRIGDSLPGRAFANSYSAQVALQLILQRRLYIRNTGIKFMAGWQFCLLEPMDLVTLTGRAGDNYLQQYPARITAIEENDNGDLTFTCEDPQPGQAAPVRTPTPPPIVLDGTLGYANYIGSGTGGYVTTNVIGPITTAHNNSVLVLWITLNMEGSPVPTRPGGFPNITSVTDSAGLTWARRLYGAGTPAGNHIIPGGYGGGDIYTVNEIWYAHMPTAGTTSVTVVCGTDNPAWFNACLFGVNGVNYLAPWDSNPPTVAMNLTNVNSKPQILNMNSTTSQGVGLFFESSFDSQALAGGCFENSAAVPAWDGGGWDFNYASANPTRPIAATQNIQIFIALETLQGCFGHVFGMPIRSGTFATIDYVGWPTQNQWILIGDVMKA